MTRDPMLLRHEAGSMVPDTIPGVLDGLVTTSSGPDGGVSLHVVAGTDDARAAGCWHIELVLHPEHAELLGAVLLRERPARPGPSGPGER